MPHHYTLAEKLKSDIPAGLVVFLVALPLCLGIAMASGAPPLSGIISGIIGGLVVGSLSLSKTSVSGPAAGLAAVVWAAIHELGSFDVFLVAVLLAGAMQLLMGLFKLGFVSNYVPSNVVKGLLASIGILLILKQIPHAVGYDKDAEGDFAFFQSDGENTFSELIKMLDFINPGAVIISVLSLLVLVLWDKTPMKKVNFFPASLFVVLMGIGLNALFCALSADFCIEQSHLVTIPPIDTGNLGAFVHIPDWSLLGNTHVLLIAVEIAIVASLETILNIEAVDRIDPLKRTSPANRELMAQGVGNITAGFLGGIPVTSVIVRSSVNINSGNKTKWSAILHGVFMLVSVLLLSPYLNLIPLSSLAAILLVTGYKLAKVSLFKDMYKKGSQQFVPFVVTILAIIFTDLLIGILIGLAFSVFYLLRGNYYNPFTLDKRLSAVGEVFKLELSEEVSFLNRASIKDALWAIPKGSKVLIDASATQFMDDDIVDVIKEFKEEYAPSRNIQLNIIGLKDKYDIKDHFHFEETLDKETQQNLDTATILKVLEEGNQRFIDGKSSKKYYLHQRDATAAGQNPMAVVVTCIDSRTSPDIIFDANIGDLLIIRIAGNVISPGVVGSVELAVRKLGIKLILVMGHSNCGAINSALAGFKEGNIAYITNKIDKAIHQCEHYHGKIDTNDVKAMERVTRLNAHYAMDEILQESPYLDDLIKQGKTSIVPAYYDGATGKVHLNV